MSGRVLLHATVSRRTMAWVVLIYSTVQSSCSRLVLFVLLGSVLHYF